MTASCFTRGTAPHDLRAGLLAADGCRPLKNGVKYYCRASLSTLPDGEVQRGSVVVGDWGANAGYFTVMAARMGYDVITVEPQPHCVQFIRAALAVSGVSHRSDLRHAFLAKGGALPDGRKAMTVPARTGCFGTFPIPLEAKVREHYDGLPGGKWSRVAGGGANVSVQIVDPAAIISDDDVVLLLKIDVEGGFRHLDGRTARMMASDAPRW